MVNKLTIVNTFVLNTLHRKITQAAITSHKTTEKIENLKCGGGGGVEKSCLMYLEQKVLLAQQPSIIVQLQTCYIKPQKQGTKLP